MYMVKERLIQSVLVCAVNELTRNSPLLKGGQKKAAKLSGQKTLANLTAAGMRPLHANSSFWTCQRSPKS